MKRILPLLFAAATAAPAMAQQFRVAPEIGVQFANQTVRWEDPIGRDYKQSGDLKPGLRLGLNFENRLARGLYLQPGVFYVRKGYEDNIGPYDYSVKVNYIEVPVNLIAKIGTGATGRFFIGGGPYVAAAVGGEAEDRNGRDYNLDFGNRRNDDFRRMDAGLNLTAGYEFPRGLYFRGLASFGLANIAPGDVNGLRIRNWGVGAGLGYYFK